MLEGGLTSAPDQTIVYSDIKRFSYRELGQRIGRLASGLGVRPGNTVGVMDWDSHRYLECFFAVPASSAKLWAGGWLHTGDIAVIGEDGYFKITDRIKDVIETGGEWVSSLDLEDLILRHPDVSEVAVIGIPDPKWSERPLAIIVAKEGGAVNEDEIKTMLGGCAEKGIIPKYAVPERIAFANSLPKTSVGKMDKKVLRQIYGK